LKFATKFGMDLFHLGRREREDIEEARQEVNVVIPGQFITQEAGFLRGHGTFVQDAQLLATISGVVERVNKLISVRPLKSRYNGEVGDVVIGRIREVGDKRWKVDVNSRQDAILLLSSVNLPGGVQRRRTNTDALQMRSFFVEDDLISAEVQQFFSDGAMSLHTRSLKYGKLEGGQFLSVSASLMKRCKSSFHSLAGGIEVILGNNGYIWIAPPPETKEANIVTREKMCRLRNSIVALSREFIAIHPDTIMTVYEASLPYPPKEILNPSLIQQLTSNARKNETLQ
jgi:exosome complex component RRP4